jgi:flagellar protein FlaH
MSKDYYSIELNRDELNRYFGGGIPKNSLVLIEGIDGNGKSVLCQRFAYALLTKGFKLTYLSTELNTLDFIKQMESLNYTIREFMLDRHLLFISMVPYLGKVKYEENFLDKVIKSDKIFENEIIVIDSLSFLMIKHNAQDEDYYRVVNFFRNLNNLNKTVIFTIDPTLIPEKFLALIRSTCDIFLDLQPLESSTSGNVKIINLKRFKRPNDTYIPKIPFRVEPKEGLIIEIGSYA